MSNASAKLLAAAVLTAMLALAASHAVELDPKAVVYQLPDPAVVVTAPTGGVRRSHCRDCTRPPQKWVAGNYFGEAHFHQRPLCRDSERGGRQRTHFEP
jgi:hypothetical protein